MTVANILLYVALIGYILYRRVQGRPMKAGRRLFLLPVVLIVLGYGDVTHGAAVKPIEIVLTVVAGVISLSLGMLRGRADKISDRDGAPFVQWGAVSLMLFAANVVAKLVLDIIGIAAGSTGSATEKSLILTFGLTLLGEAIVLWMRTAGTTASRSLPGGGSFRAPPSSVGGRSSATPAAESVAAYRPEGAAPSAATTATGLVDAAERHHRDHRERRQERHERRRARHGR